MTIQDSIVCENKHTSLKHSINTRVSDAAYVKFSQYVRENCFNAVDWPVWQQIYREAASKLADMDFFILDNIVDIANERIQKKFN